MRGVIWRMRGASFMLGVMLVFGGTAAATSESGAALYEAAIHTMAALPIPPYIAYRLDGASQSPEPLRLWLYEDDAKQVWLAMSPGNSRATWLVLHRTADFANAIAGGTGFSYYTRRSFFDITWDGAYHALRDGIVFNGVQRDPKAISGPNRRAPVDCSIGTIAAVSVPGAYNVQEAAATPHPVASPSPPPCRVPAHLPSDPALRTIALLRVMGPSAYGISDAGTVARKNGDPGRRLHFTPRSDPDAHQLTDAIVDVRLMRLCMMRFRNPVSGATLKQHYADVDGYWLQSDGVVTHDFAVPLRGGGYQPNLSFPTLPFWDSTYRQRFTWAYKIEGIAFPTSVPDVRFSPEHP